MPARSTRASRATGAPRIAASFAALLALGLAGGLLGPRLRAPPRPTVLAMLPFEDGSGDARLDFAAAGLPKALGDELKGTLGVPVVSYYRLLNEVGSVTAPRKDWAAAAQRAGATYLVHGKILPAAEGVDIAVALSRPDGREVWRIARHAGVEEIPTTVRAFAPEIAKAAGVPTHEAATPTVRSFAFEQAMLRAHAAMGEHRFNDAQQRLTEAYEADPTAPEPLYYRALVYWWTAADENVIASALDVAEKQKLSPPQRAFLDGLRQLEKLNHPAAVLRFSKALEQFPGDHDNLYGLAEAEFHGGFARDGIATYRKLCALEPSWSLGLFHAMDQYGARGDPEGLAWLLDRPDVKRDPQYNIWRVRAPFALRDVDGAIDTGLKLLDAEPAGPMTAAALDVLRVVVQAYLVRGNYAEAQALVDQVAANLQPRLMVDRIGLARAQGTSAPELEAELARMCDAEGTPLSRLYCWSPTLDVELPRGPGPRLDAIRAAITANSPQPPEASTGAQTMAALLAGTYDEPERLKQLTSSRFPEASAIAQAFLDEREHALAAAQTQWKKAMDATTEGRFLIIEAWLLAKNRRAAADPAGVIAACDDVLRPRAFRYSWATTAGPCLLWTAEAQLALGKKDAAKASLERLMQLRIAAPAGDPLLLDAKKLLLQLPD